MMQVGLLIVSMLLARPSMPGQRIADGQDAVARASAFLNRMGVSGNLYLTSLAETDGKPWGRPGKLWVVGLENAAGSWGVNLDLDGRARFVSGKLKNRAPYPPMATEAARQATMKMLGRLGKHPPVDIEIVQAEGEICATCRDRVGDRSLFNLNPLYGYILHFAPGTMTLTYLIDEHEPPKPNATTPRIDEKRATEIFNRYLPSDRLYKQAQDFVKVLHGVVGVHLNLGYYKFPKEPTARLVWRATLTTRIPGPEREFGEIPRLVDAVTGQLLAPDYNSSER